MLPAIKLKSVSILEKYQRSIIFTDFGNKAFLWSGRLNLKAGIGKNGISSGLQLYIHGERFVHIILSFAFRW